MNDIIVSEDEFMEFIDTIGPNVIDYIDPSCQTDNIARKVLEKNAGYITSIDKSLVDVSLLRHLIQTNAYGMQYISEEDWTDDLIKYCVSMHPTAINYFLLNHPSMVTEDIIFACIVSDAQKYFNLGVVHRTDALHRRLIDYVLDTNEDIEYSRIMYNISGDLSNNLSNYALFRDIRFIRFINDFPDTTKYTFPIWQPIFEHKLYTLYRYIPLELQTKQHIAEILEKATSFEFQLRDDLQSEVVDKYIKFHPHNINYISDDVWIDPATIRELLVSSFIQLQYLPKRYQTKSLIQEFATHRTLINNLRVDLIDIDVVRLLNKLNDNHEKLSYA